VAVSSGACKLICPGLTNWRYAALPSISTLVPPSDVGKSPFQMAVPLARLFPKIDTHSPGWMMLTVPQRGTTPRAKWTVPAPGSCERLSRPRH